MRIRIVILLAAWLCALSLIAQSESFKVVYADNAVVGSKRLEALDGLNDGDLVKSSGLTVLVHRTGLFFAIEKDSVLNILQMDSTVLANLGMQSCDNDWPELEQLFKIERQYGHRGALYAGMPAIEFLFNGSKKAHPKQQVVIGWKDVLAEIEQYEFTIKDVFDNHTGDMMVTRKEQILIPLDTFHLDPDFPIVIFNVRNAMDSYASEAEMGLKLSSTSYYMPDSFEANSAVEALEIAFYLDEERSAKEAQQFYELAKQFSDHPFYQSMLENFRKRFPRK